MVHHGKLTFPIGYIMNNDTMILRGHEDTRTRGLSIVKSVPGVITVVKKLNVVRKTNIFYMHFAFLYIYLTNNNAFVT